MEYYAAALALLAIIAIAQVSRAISAFAQNIWYRWQVTDARKYFEWQRQAGQQDAEFRDEIRGEFERVQSMYGEILAALEAMQAERK